MLGLYEITDGQYQPWNSGANNYDIFKTHQHHKRPVRIVCRFGELDFNESAVLDTGAEWSILNESTIKILDIFSSSRPKDKKYITAHGEIEGYLTKLNVVFVSNPEWGIDLTIEATVFVTDEWTGPNMIGYRGLLDHMKIALQPSHVDDNNIFFFAQSA